MPATSLARHPLLGSYYPAIDGLRAIAILAVFLHHSFGYLAPGSVWWWGWTGVDLFFVISGFLITGILHDAKGLPRYFRNFYIRRTLRIFPLFYALWIGFLLLSVFSPMHWNRTYLLDALYLQNYMPHFVRNWTGDTADLFLLNFSNFFGHTLTLNIYHFWSLCIEEQFYLVWPLLVWVLRRKQLMALCAFCIAAVPMLRLYIVLHPTNASTHFQLIYTSTYTRFDTLLIGALLALWLRSERVPSTVQITRLAWSAMAVSFAILVAGQLILDRGAPRIVEQPFLCTAGFTLIALISASLVSLAIDSESALARVLRHPVMLHLGRISYGFYIFHFLLEVHMMRLSNGLRRFGLMPLGPVVMFAVAYLLARLSYRWLELPFLRLKSRFSDRKHVEAPIELAAS